MSSLKSTQRLGIFHSRLCRIPTWSFDGRSCQLGWHAVVYPIIRARKRARVRRQISRERPVYATPGGEPSGQYGHKNAAKRNTCIRSTHARAHTRTHAQTHIRTHAHAHPHMHARTQECRNTHMYVGTRARTPTHMHTNARTRAPKHIYTHTQQIIIIRSLYNVVPCQRPQYV